jgi:hypothetical protein
MTNTIRIRTGPARGTRQLLASDAKRFSAHLTARPKYHVPDGESQVDKPAILCDSANRHRLFIRESLMVRIVNGPLAGFTLNVTAASEGLVVRLKASNTALYARAMRVHQQLEAELATQFAQPISLEWLDAPDSH